MMSTKVVFVLCLIGMSLAGPLNRDHDQGELFSTEEVGLPAVGPLQVDRQAGVGLGILAALSPVVGTVVGPLITNLASGFVTFLTGITRPGNSTRLDSRPSFDAYMINIPGARGPYMLLTQENAFGESEKLNTSSSNTPNQLAAFNNFNIAPFGKIRIKSNSVSRSEAVDTTRNRTQSSGKEIDDN